MHQDGFAVIYISLLLVRQLPINTVFHSSDTVTQYWQSQASAHWPQWWGNSNTLGAFSTKIPAVSHERWRSLFWWLYEVQLQEQGRGWWSDMLSWGYCVQLLFTFFPFPLLQCQISGIKLCVVSPLSKVLKNFPFNNTEQVCEWPRGQLCW